MLLSAGFIISGLALVKNRTQALYTVAAAALLGIIMGTVAIGGTASRLPNRAKEVLELNNVPMGNKSKIPEKLKKKELLRAADAIGFTLIHKDGHSYIWSDNFSDKTVLATAGRNNKNHWTMLGKDLVSKSAHIMECHRKEFTTLILKRKQIETKWTP